MLIERATDRDLPEVLALLDEHNLPKDDVAAHVSTMVVARRTEGAGAAAFATAWREREMLAGQRVGVALTGGNVDTGVFADVLAGKY